MWLMIVFLANAVYNHLPHSTHVGDSASIMWLMIVFQTNVVYNHVPHLIKLFSTFCPTVLWFRTEIKRYQDIGGMFSKIK
jgi:hypothetical protein